MYPGINEGVRIHRRFPPGEWRAQVDAIEDPELRAGAERYLAGPAACYRALRNMAKECGCRSLDEFNQLRKQARRAGAPGAVPWARAGRPEPWRGG